MFYNFITFLDKHKFYTYTLCGLLIWLSLFDSNDFGAILKLNKKISELNNEIEFYDEKIKIVEQDRKEVFGSPKLKEKFAREKYFMKKADEEVFVLLDKDQKPFEQK
jgi:cell division protein DivIC